MDEFNQLYEDWVDHIINTRPLTSSRISEYNDVINVNQQIVNHIYNIRRHLEMTDDEYTDNINQFANFENNLVNNMFNNFGISDTTNLFENGIVSRLFSVLLEGTSDSVNNMEDVKVTLTHDQFNKLFCEKISEYNIEKYKSDCNICMDEYKVDDVIVKLGCNHIFHKDCIYNWLCNERITCPVCRKDTREITMAF